MSNKKEEFVIDETMDVVDPEKTLENRRKFVKDAMKPAEKARDELEKATATEKVRLQGTKEPEVPSLKPYTEALDVKNRNELGKLIESAKKENRPWKVKRCSEEKENQGYRYTFYTTVLKEELQPTRVLNEEDGDELVDNELELDVSLEEPEEKPEESEEVVTSVGEIKDIAVCAADAAMAEEENSEEHLSAEEVKEITDEVVDDHLEAKAEEESEEEVPAEDVVELELEPVEESLKEAKEEEEEKEEPKLDTFEEQMDFLAADEEEAISGYDLVLGLVKDEHVKEQLHHIRDEEVAHREFLRAVKDDPTLVYSHEEHEKPEEDEEEMVDLDMDSIDGLESEETIDINLSDLASLQDESLKEAVDIHVDENNITIADDSGEEVAIIPINPEEGELEEASSAEKKAFRHGGEDAEDLIQGRAIARVKDPHERAMLIHQRRMEKNGKKMSDRPEVKQTLDRKVNQAAASYEKKAASMARAGMTDEEQPLDESAKISLDDLSLFNPWGGAKDLWELLVSQDKLEELDKALEDMYPEGITTSELNDILWFEKDWVMEKTGVEPFMKQDDAIEVDAEFVEPVEEA